MKTSRIYSDKRLWGQKIAAMVIVLSLLAGCQFPWKKTTKEPAGIDESPGTEFVEMPTPEPRQDLPPAVVEIYPLPDTVIDLQQPITVYFNQPMDTKSVEAAIHFEPGISGQFVWEDDKILIFTPDQALSAGSDLHLTIDTTAQAANAKNLQSPYEVRFRTVDALKILQVFPPEGAQEIDPQSTIFVVFNQPVVPLGAESEGPQGFEISPESPGTGEWLNTSTYTFTPQPSLDGGRDYTIQVTDALNGVSGAALDPEQVLQFAFSTTTPALEAIRPNPEQRLSLDGPIELTFNIAMDPESVESHFALLAPDGSRIPGNFEWDEDLKTMTFTPGVLLGRNAAYIIRLRAGAESAGGLAVETAMETTRRTYPVFSVDPLKAPGFRSYYAQFGSYQIPFTGPIDRTNYKNAVSILPEISARSLYLSEGNSQINLSGYFLPETRYTLTLETDIQDIWGASLGESVTYTFTTPPADPALSLVTGPTSNNLVFVPASSPEAILQATNINTVTISIAPITISDLITLLHPDNYDYRQTFLPESMEFTIHNLDLQRNLSQIVRIPLAFQGEPLAHGVYYMGIGSADIDEESQQRYQKYYVIVSENNLVLKIAPEQALVWATKLADQSPMDDVPVKIYNTEGEQLASGLTDNNGLFLSEIDRSGVYYTNFFMVLGEPGTPEFGFSISTWGLSYAFYEMGIRLNTSPDIEDAYIYTDRPIYRPGDTIHFKVVVYKRDNGVPAAPDYDSVTVSLNSDAGIPGISRTIYSETLPLSRFGTVSDSIQLPDNAPTGYYYLEVEKDEDLIHALYFNVKAYRKPEIEVSVNFDKEALMAGDPLEAAVQADYYFGLPAADQTFTWTFFRDGAYFDLPGYQVGPLSANWLSPYYYPDYSPLGDAVDSGQGKTDLEGGSILEFSSADLFTDETTQGSPYEANLEVTLVDESGYPVSFRESALVHPESFYIGVQPEIIFGRANSAFNFSILTVDWGKDPVSRVPLEAVFETIRWQAEATMNPEQPYRYVPETTFVGSASPVTDTEGKARVSFTPEEPGTYRLTLSSGDAVTQIVVWVTGESAAIWPKQTQNRIELIPDAESYQAGQTAKIFIPNSFVEGGTALVSIERGEVMDTQIVELTGSGDSISVPITEESIPNIYVSVVLMGIDDSGRPDYRQGILNLPVEPLAKTLDVALILDPVKTEPGETVAATLTVLDATGNPVQGEFSVSVVDKAVLALVGPISPSILAALYGEQPLSVQTSYSLKTYANQLALANLDLGRGGGGGDVINPTIREDFPDTAFWQGDVVTGMDGTARLSIPLPDSLTTWVVTVRGLTEAYLVGEAQAEIITQKDLMIRPVTPRFLVEGDQVEMAAVVHNNTAQALEVAVMLQSIGFSLQDEALKSQAVSIPANGQTRITWWGKVESVQFVELVFQATAGDLADASKPQWGDLPVLRFNTPLTFSTSGELSGEGERQELVSLPVSTDPSAGSLSVALHPSLTAILLDGIKALEADEYQNTVSILSRLLANLNTYLAMRDLGIDSASLDTELIEQIETGVQALLESQLLDGGWSWWGDAKESDPFISAYVLLGLQQASQAGLDVGENFIEQGVIYLRSQLVQPGEASSSVDLDRLAFQLYALRELDVNPDLYLSGLYARRSELSPWSLGLLALTINSNRSTDSRVSILLTDLERRAVRTATSVHWESDQTSWVLPGTPIFNTAVGVYTLAQLDPASTSISPALRYLLAYQQVDSGWPSIFETAWSLMAITEALQGFGDAQADFDFTVLLNDVEIAEGTTANAISQSTVSANIPITSLYPESPNVLLVQRSEGTGTLYYRADLRTYQLAETAAPVNRGITIQKNFYSNDEVCMAIEDCTPIHAIKLDPSDPTQAVRIALTVIVPNDMYQFMMEDYIPAGMEVLDLSLKTTRMGDEGEIPGFDPRSPFKNGWGWWYFTDPQIYDDHLLWTANYLPAGTYTLTYMLIPLQRGTFQVLPAHAWQYFFPEVMGTSAGDIFKIE